MGDAVARTSLLLTLAVLAPPTRALAQDPATIDPKRPVPTVEADMVELEVAPGSLEFGPVALGASRSLDLALRNRGSVPLELQSLSFLQGTSGNSSGFEVVLGGRRFVGGTGDVLRVIQPPLVLARGEETVATVTYDASTEQLDAFVLRVVASGEATDVPVSALGSHYGDHYLHVVIEGPQLLVDYDGDGSELVSLDGSGSHTHEPGRTLAGYEWRIGAEILAHTAVLETFLSAPWTEITLAITDDGVPPRVLEGQVEVHIVPPDQVPGVLARYYRAKPGGASALLDAVLPAPDYIEQRPDLSMTGSLQVGGSPFTGDVLVQLEGRLAIQLSGYYGFTVTGGAGHRLLLDGEEMQQPRLLLPGSHALELRVAVDALADLPLGVALERDGLPEPITPDLLTHDETGIAPVLHALTPSGAAAGGDPITIDGFGFFPADQILLYWGDEQLAAADFTLLTPSRIQFPSPPGSGTIQVSVANASGVSLSHPFEYLNEDLPVQFHRDLILEVPSPTGGVWGPDGRLYVISLDGSLRALEFDEDYELVSQSAYPGVAALPNHEALSITVNPYDPPDPIRLYVGHGDLFLHDGEPPTGPSPYTGQVSVLTGPDFAEPVPLVTGLPVSNNSHSVNGLAFDDNGDLLASIGSMTNAGVRHPGLGDLPESPLSAAVIKAHLSRPGFNGTVTYVETLTGLPNDDQRFGESVDVAPGVDVEVHAPGLRNAFGLVYTTRGKLYLTDNGPNVGHGPASTGPDTQAPDPADQDELDLIEWNNYYGLPNRSRGRTDPRQNVYYGSSQGPPSIPDTLFQMLAPLQSSSDGLDEYRADTFQGQLRGELIVQRFLGKLGHVRLSPDGRALVSQTLIEPVTRGLACVTGPGGALVSLDYQNSQVEVLEPTEEGTPVLTVHDIFPWRAPTGGGTPFVIGGRGFGGLENTVVRIDGREAELVEVTSRRIRGFVPPTSRPSPALLDVEVSVGERTDVLPAAFRYLLGAGQEPGRWEGLASAGAELAAVAAGVVDGTLLLVGNGSRMTFAYDLLTRQWLPNGAARPYPGLYHAAEVMGERLYLIGGLGGGAEGRVQIYERDTNTWTTGAELPWPGGAVATAVIGGQIYAAGGFTATLIERRCARYDPLNDAWVPLAPMPLGLSHAASGTDGERLYVFGGRIGFLPVVDGFDFVQIYDPATDEWTWSGALGSTLAPLPEGRSGMGKAVFLRGEFHLFGGETLTDPDANADGVYDRVDVYDPRTNTWRSEAPMPSPRHGICPVLFQGHVFLAGGATRRGLARSSLFDTFTRQ